MHALGRYTLDGELGSGAIGTVFTGTDKFGNRFAVKVILPELAGVDGVAERFVRDRTRLQSARHPNVVAVHDVVLEDATIALVVDQVAGGDLRGRLREQGPFLPTEVARIGNLLASGLVEVHRVGLVHGNIRPENVLMDSATPKLADFGLSWLSGSSDFRRLQYLAPECIGIVAEPSPAADVYALGVLLYELLCGVTPFASVPVGERTQWRPGWPEGLHEEFQTLLARMVAVRPGDRLQPAEIEAALAAMEPFLIGQSVVMTPPGPERLARPSTGPGPGPSTGISFLSGGFMAKEGGSRSRRRVVAGVVVVGLIAGGWLVFRPSADSPASAPDAAPVTATGQQAPTRAPTTTTEAALTIAPNLIGKQLKDAQDSLPPSVRLTTEDVIDESAAEGAVVDQSPKPGESMVDGRIKVSVARAAQELQLSTLKPASGEWSSNSDAVVTLAGADQPHSLTTSVHACSGTDSVEYNVGKRYRKLKATAGIDDGSADSTLRVQLEVFADGRSIFGGPVEFGKAQPIEGDLSGVLRLKFQWRGIANAKKTCPGPNRLVIGNPVVYGLPGPVSDTNTPTTTR